MRYNENEIGWVGNSGTLIQGMKPGSVPYAIGYRSTDHRCPRPTLSPVPFEVHRGRAGEMIDGAHDQSRRIRWMD